jgi:ABC-type multidrug transport system ATPase subunit
VIETLADMLADRSPAIRAAALRSSAALDSDGFVAILSGLDPDPDWHVRTTMASILSTLPTRTGLPRLNAMLGDSDQRVIAAVLNALVKIGAPNAGALLLDHLSADDPVVRAAAAAGLGELRAPAGAQALPAAYQYGLRDSTYIARAAVVEAFNLGLGMHSDRELGISTAAMVHLACSIPNLTYPIDSHYHDQTDDIITQPWVYRDGQFALPTGPGLGVELDRDKLDFYHRYFLDNVAGWILELDRSRGIPYEGNYSSWLEQKQKRMALEEKTEKARQRTIAAELDWVRQNPKGRQTKQKARLANFEALVAQERNVKLDEVQIHIPTSTHLGNVVVETEGLRKGFGDKLLIEDLTFSLPRGGIVGVIGPNGAGKTTLFRMITGSEQPDAGTLRVGETVQMAYVDQSRDALDPDKSVWEEISDGLDLIKVGDHTMNSRAYTSGFNFKGTDQQKKVGKLSGGERNRLHLAKLLRTGGNLLLLDEPTNDLDTDTLRALEEALLSFAGCAVVISHDRWFLDRIATHVLAFEGDSQVTWFEGNFEAYEEHRRELLGDEADRPHRITYKKLTRT